MKLDGATPNCSCRIDKLMEEEFGIQFGNFSIPSRIEIELDLNFF
jgi:hypothetical protein